MKNKKRQVCKRCVMDTSDLEIEFDDNGICNHCHKFDNVTSKNWYPNEEGTKKLKKIFQKIRNEGKNKEYDCIIGLSGGCDSSYVALLIKDHNLRPLVVHVDAGWNSELAVYNIEQIIKYCGFELYTHVMNWEEIRDLQISFLKAGVSNQDTVQDHAFFATLYHFAVKNNISYVISGGNIATESVFPSSWHHTAMDAIHVKSIHKKYGTKQLKDYKTISIFQKYFYYPFVKKMKIVRPLNYMKYNREEALSVLKEKIGYKEYGRKHGESKFTKFFQNYYLPTKFDIDKRKPHLSSMILSGELTREQALKELELPLYSKNELREDKEYITKKLGLTEQELDNLIKSSGRSYKEYRNWDKWFTLIKKIQVIAETFLNRNIRN